MTVNAVNGMATFSTLTLNKVGTGYKLSASATGLTGATSDPFNITAASPSQVAFIVEPSTTVAGFAISPAVQVQVQDAYGNPETTATNAITLALGANPGGSTLTPITLNAVNGMAISPRLS